MNDRAYPASLVRRVTILVIFHLAPGFMVAQEPAVVSPLVTDRPDFTESPLTVPLGDVQIESGATWAGVDDAESVSGPELLLRWGFASSWELRVGVPGYVFAEGTEGFGDGSLGFKTELGETGSWEWGTILSASIPTGEDGFGSDGVDPELLLTTGRDIGRSWSIGTQASVARRTDASETEVGATLVAGRSLGAGAASFLELAAAGGPGSSTEVILHHGYTLRAGALSQLDLHLGVGLTDSAPDFLLGAGWSGRF